MEAAITLPFHEGFFVIGDVIYEKNKGNPCSYG